MKTSNPHITERAGPLTNVHRVQQAAFTEVNGWKVPLHFGSIPKERKAVHKRVAVIDLSLLGKIFLRGQNLEVEFKAFVENSPTEIGQVIPIHDMVQERVPLLRIAYLAQGEHFILTPPGEEEELRTTMSTSRGWGEKTVWTDQTAGLMGMAIAGPSSRDVMRKLCSLPLDHGALPNFHAVQTRFAKTRTIIIRHDLGGNPCFELFADRSYAEYLWQAVLDAGLKAEIQPVGWRVYSEMRK